MSEVNLDAVKLLSRRQVAEALGRSPDTLDAWVRKGLFPAPLQAAPGAPKQWRYKTVMTWLEKRSRARYVAPAKRGQLKRGNRMGGV
jgi:predicted DNA-binding transcriptional regulator AlpA